MDFLGTQDANGKKIKLHDQLFTILREVYTQSYSYRLHPPEIRRVNRIYGPLKKHLWLRTPDLTILAYFCYFW